MHLSLSMRWYLRIIYGSNPEMQYKMRKLISWRVILSVASVP